MKINTFLSTIYKAFPALKHRNYRLYFTGQLVSLIGVWLQIVAQGWLVFELTHSAFMVGVASALGSLPVLFFVLFGGVIVDRLPKKGVLIYTQSAALILALILGLLTVFNLINVYEIFVLSFLLGVVSALDRPARQAFAVDLVGKKDLASAIALNSGAFNGARAIGPAFAGITISLFGAGGAFMLNAATYLAIIIALFMIKIKEILPQKHSHPLKALQEGISYSYFHPQIKHLLIFTAMISIFGWNYSVIMPVVAKDIFHEEVKVLGYLYAAIGIGAVFGTIIVSSLSQKIKAINLVFTGNIIFCISTILFTLTQNLSLALILLFFSGCGLLMQSSTVNSIIQHMVSDHLRGRVMSIHAFMFMGLFPIGSFIIGFMTEHFGAPFSIAFNTVVVLISGIGLYMRYNREEQIEIGINEELQTTI